MVEPPEFEQERKSSTPLLTPGSLYNFLFYRSMFKFLQSHCQTNSNFQQGMRKSVKWTFLLVFVLKTNPVRAEEICLETHRRNLFKKNTLSNKDNRRHS